ncbi:4-hydroxy-2-oxovalerate aldolase [Streptomyces bauhiniae]|uniref:4-hydroxy-2-oxovalerate aldolase n=1 Tax=Streptomyces bauhiniae TaxID=2340725 RepID=A0A7K3QYM2_9ACTN|nr:4-hydroxy-2-oxovalerate aldolase [Streptomyces bauhiniae]NEB94891.1 4-hydroxy-2-oxovalerate aldolase [Streptomyces bauhiniae]
MTADRPGLLGSPVIHDGASRDPLADRAISVCDTTLRDGSHSVAHQFTVDDVRAVARGLDAAGVHVVEVTHGDGLGGSSFNYGFGAESDLDLIKAARAELTTSKLAALLLPGIGTIDDLKAATAEGIDIVRVATHCTEADIAVQHLRAAKQQGLETVGFLMMSHMTSPSALAEQAQIMRDSGADTIYVVDSAGALLPHQVVERVQALRDRLDDDVILGMHAHNNLGVGVANALAAAEAGAGILDGSCHGLGAGAGNAATEVMVAALDRAGADTGIVTRLLIDVAEEVVAQRCAGKLPSLDRGSLLLGYAGIYSSFLLHTRRAAARYGVPEAEIIVELGRRRVVGGQEDMIIDVALELSSR